MLELALAFVVGIAGGAYLKMAWDKRSWDIIE